MTGRANGELERLRRIDRLCESAERRWKRGERPSIEDSLSQGSDEDRPVLLSELLQLEWSYRRANGEKIDPADYRARFADQAEAVDRAWRRWLGGETATQASSLAPETVMPSPDPTFRPSRVEEPADAPLPGGYADWVFIGEGGMGAVYRARDPRLRRTVAVKKLHALTPSRLARFRTEAEALARLSHPHIVQVFALEEIDSQPCLVMEYIPHGSLEERLGRRALPPSESARLVAILARAVQAAHEKGIVHRDLKPGNVLMADPVTGSGENILGGFPKVSDFGLARLAGEDSGQTGTGQVLGTPHYMAPEQALGRVREIGPPCDVWALGVILYRCLAGQLPFSGDSVLETLDKVRVHTPDTFAKLGRHVPADLEAVCMRCLEKELVKRPTAGELADALESWVKAGTAATAPGLMVTPRPGAGKMGGLSQGLQGDTLDLPAAPRRERSRRGLLIGLGVAAMLLVAVGVTAWGLRKGPDESKRNGGTNDKDSMAVTDKDADKEKDKDKQQVVVPKKRPPQVKVFRVLHWADRGETAEFMGELGDKSHATLFNDHVKIGVEFAEPAYAYLIAYNPDGKEQLLWPVGEDKGPSEEVAPPDVFKITYPVRTGKVFILNDKEDGGLQAFALVASQYPLPSFKEWKQKRGPAAWKEFKAGKGVWEGDEDGLWERQPGVPALRGAEGERKDAPPVVPLCKSLKKAGAAVVWAVAFPVKPKPKKEED